MTNQNAHVIIYTLPNDSWTDITASTDTGSGTYILKGYGPGIVAVAWGQYSAGYSALDPATSVCLGPGDQTEMYLDQSDAYGRVVAQSVGTESGLGFWRKA